VYFVGWDGTPEVPAPDHYAAEEVSTETVAASLNELPTRIAFENPPEISVENPIEQEWVVPDGQNPDENAGYAEALPVEEEEAYDFSTPLAENPHFNPQGTAPAPETPSTMDQAGFQDIAEFGNSDTQVGPLSYTIAIEGIDTGKIYGELREALADSRFRWNVPEMLKTIHEGRIEIKDMNPAKAFMLVNRIKYLAVKITWRQNVLS
jgi:hypothetical protein